MSDFLNAQYNKQRREAKKIVAEQRAAAEREPKQSTGKPLVWALVLACAAVAATVSIS